MEAVAEQSSQGTASRSSAPGGGGGVRRYPPEHLSFLTTTNVILPPPPPSMGSLTDMWGIPPPLCEIFCSTVCTLIGVRCAP